MMRLAYNTKEKFQKSILRRMVVSGLTPVNIVCMLKLTLYFI